MAMRHSLFSLLVLLLLASFCVAQSSEESTVVEEVEETVEEVNCAQHNACDTCTDESGCVWCESDTECVQGGFFGPSTFFPSCSNWKYKQCSINGRYYTWYPLLVILLLIVVACCCGLITFMFCNPVLYAYKQYKNKGAYVKWEQMQQDMETGSGTPTDDQVRRESLRKKWNLN